MFSDNETDVDLLGFEDQVEEIALLVTSPNLLPITIGVLGDWGSGKSSLLRMAAKRIADEDIVVVLFSPWRIESYDDAKSALLDAVVDAVTTALPKDDPPLLEKAMAHVRRLRKRIRWLHVAGLAAKHLVTLTAPTLDELDGILKDDGEDQDLTTSAQVARDFHAEFEELIDSTSRNVLVLVDDLDRCLPEQVLDVLQAIKLFLAVPGTAFVLATDERVVRDAVRIRYPQATAASETDLPQEYLEKIVQVPLRIPPLGPAEVESFLNLLVAEQHLASEDIAKVRERAGDVRRAGLLPIAMNVGIAREALGSKPLPKQAEKDFETMGQISALLAAGLKGNPRQLKRFLNTLELRRRAAERRHVDVDLGVLTKMTVLEYSRPRNFRELYDWHSSAGGPPPELAAAESAVRKAAKSVKKAATSEPKDTPQEWTTSPWLRSWLELDPTLADVNLGPYFALARDTLKSSAMRARRLPELSQSLLDQMASTNEKQSESATKDAVAKLSESELAELVEAASERLGVEASPRNLEIALLSAAEAVHSLTPAVLVAIGRLPYTAISPDMPLAVVNRLSGSGYPELVIGLMDAWETQGINPALSKGAALARKARLKAR